MTPQILQRKVSFWDMKPDIAREGKFVIVDTDNCQGQKVFEMWHQILLGKVSFWDITQDIVGKVGFWDKTPDIANDGKFLKYDTRYGHRK